MYDNIKEMLIKNEGLVLQVYKDSLGYDTIGVGRCLDKNGISEDEAMYLLENDIERVIASLDKNWSVFRTFPPLAQEVAIDCTFQMGITGWMNFPFKTQAGSIRLILFSISCSLNLFMVYCNCSCLAYKFNN